MFDQVTANLAPMFNSSWDPYLNDPTHNMQLDGQREGVNGYATDWSGAFSGLGQVQNAKRNPDGTFTVIRTAPGSSDPMSGQIGTVSVGPDGKISLNGGWQEYKPQSDSSFFKDMALTGLAAGGALYGMGALGGSIGGGAGAGVAAGASDPMAAYLTSGGVEGSFGVGGTGVLGTAGANGIGSYLTGMGGAEGSLAGAGFTGATPTASMLPAGVGGGGGLMGTIGNFLGTNPTTTANLIGNGISTIGGLYAQNQAVKAQQEAAAQSNALLKSMYDQTRADNLPALQARNNGLTGYQNLLQNPSSITSDPGYQFGFNQGQAAYDNSGAARGMRLSGAQAKALTRYGQDYAGTKYDNALNRYGNLAGLGQVGSGTIANSGMNYGNQAANNITGAGNSAAAGYIGGANTIAGGVNNFLRYWNENNLLKQIGLGG